MTYRILFLLFLISICACSQVEPDVDYSQAVDYTLCRREDLSFAGRDRYRYFVSTEDDSLTNDQYAHTAIKAALELHEKDKGQLTCVHVMTNRQDAMDFKNTKAMADYSPDGWGVSGKDDVTLLVELWNEFNIGQEYLVVK